MKTSISRRRMMCVVAASSILPEIAAGQTRYLGQPMTIVVPFAPGGSADLYARSLGTELAFKLGRPVLVVNKPGAGGNVGAAEVARNGIDGRFLLYTTTSIAINQTLYPSTNGFKLFNDLMPVAIVAVMPHVLVTKKSLSVKSTGDLLASLRANPQRYNYSSAGPGTSAHLSAELFLRNTRTSAAHVPYRGGSQAVLAVVSEEVDFAMMASFQALPLLKTGRVNALAITAAKRSPALPDLPTLIEQGVDVESYQWHGLFVSAEVKKEVVQTLHQETQSWLAKPSTVEKILSDCSEPIKGSLEQSDAFVRAEVSKWAKAVSFSGAKPE